MPEHVNIDDPEIHEPKGASSAAADQIIVADGSGGTSWESASSVLDPSDFTRENLIQGGSTADQEVTAADTVFQVEFGSAINGSSDPVQLLSDGTVQVNEDNLYIVEVKFHIGKIGGNAGISRVIGRPLLNASELQKPFAQYVDQGELVNYRGTFLIDLVQNDLLTFEIYVDSGGAASDGGLYATTTTLSGWSDVPSAEILVQRYIP